MIDQDLFLSILSMDVYNRQYNQGILGLSADVGTSIGFASIFTDSSIEILGSEAAGFYGIAYDVLDVPNFSATTVISYRGTDEYNPLDPSNDLLNGWTIGAGFANQSQAKLAIDFYQQVTLRDAYSNAPPPSAILTGHSLGGGLAGLVSSLSGTAAVGFDHMPFGLAAIAQAEAEAYARSSGGPVDLEALGMRVPEADRMRAYYTESEALVHVRSGLVHGVAGQIGAALTQLLPQSGPVLGAALLRLGLTTGANTNALEQQVYKEELSTYNADFDGVLAESVARHSQALLVTLMFGEKQWSAEGGQEHWKEFAEHFLPALFDEDIGQAIGRFKDITGNATAADQMTRMIAYSAINEGTRVFGDTGIRALFNDADDLGKLLSENPSWAWLNSHAEDMGRLMVHFAGKMSAGKVEQDARAYEGVFHVSEDEKTLYIDVNSSLWSKGTEENGDDDARIGLSAIANDDLNYLGFHGSGSLSSLTARPFLHSNNSVSERLASYFYNYVDAQTGPLDASVFQQFVYLTGDVQNVIVSNNRFAEEGFLSLVAGNGLANEIEGSDQDEVILGYDGDDILSGGGGKNLLIGGDGDDTAYYGSVQGKVDITYDGEENHSLTVKKSEDSVDELISIEKIVGTAGKDRVSIVGTLEQDFAVTIDANGGQTSIAETVDLSKAGASVELNILSNAIGSIKVDGSNGYIGLVGFHTDIIGSDHSDEISDLSAGPKRIDGGAGDDVITVGGDQTIIDGGAGDDVINGGSGNDTLMGGSGINKLYGNGGSDRLISSGEDELYGGDGHDMLVVSAGDTEVKLFGGAGNDVVDARSRNPVFDERGVFRPGYYLPSEGIILQFREGDGNDVLLGNGLDDYFPTYEKYYDEVNYDNYKEVNPHSWGIAAVDFGDLSIHDVTFVWEITSQDTVVSEQEGHYNHAVAGKLAIVINTTGDSLYFGNVVGTFLTHGLSLLVGDTATLLGITLPTIKFSDEFFWAGESDGAWTNGHFRLDSVTQYNTAESDYRQATRGTNEGEVQGTDGNDDLNGGSGDDAVFGGDGNDNYQASGGSDTYDGGAGNDIFSIFKRASDFAFSWQADGKIAAISLSGLEGSTILSNVEQIYSISEDRTYSIEELAGQFGTEGDDALIEGTSHNDHLFGLAGNDMLSGGAGNDTLDGGDGIDIARYAGSSNTFRIYRDKSNRLVVQDLSGAEGRDELVAIEQAHFVGDDVTIDLSAVPALGTSSNDNLIGNELANILYGLGGDDILDGQGGDDILEGGSGSDTYIITSGGGNDTIVDDGNSEEDQDTIDLTWLNPQDVILRRSSGQHDAGDLLIEIIATGEIVRVKDQFKNWLGKGIEAIAFADDILWDRSAIAGAAQILGTQGNDELYGSMVDGAFRAGTGDDTLHSFEGADTVHYQAGDGNKVFWDRGYRGDGDTLFLTDLNLEEITLVRNNFDLIVTVIGTGHTITVKDQFKIELSESGDGYYWIEKGIEFIRFANDDILDFDGIAVLADPLPLLGTEGDDILVGTRFADTILAGAGNDRLYAIDGPGDLLDGGDGDDQLYGSDASDHLIGGAGNDVLHGAWGDDILDGGAGDDVAYFGGSSTDFIFQVEADGSLTVKDTRIWGSGWDNLTNIEMLYFAGDGVTLNVSDLMLENFRLTSQQFPAAGSDWKQSFRGDRSMNGYAMGGRSTSTPDFRDWKEAFAPSTQASTTPTTTSNDNQVLALIQTMSSFGVRSQAIEMRNALESMDRPITYYA